MSFLLLWPRGCGGQPGLQCPDASPFVLLPKQNASVLSCSLLVMVGASQGGREDAEAEAALTLLVMSSSATRVCSSLCCSVLTSLRAASSCRCCVRMWYRLERASVCSWLTVSCSSLMSLFCAASLDSCSVMT